MKNPVVLQYLCLNINISAGLHYILESYRKKNTSQKNVQSILPIPHIFKFTSKSILGRNFKHVRNAWQSSLLSLIFKTKSLIVVLKNKIFSSVWNDHTFCSHYSIDIMVCSWDNSKDCFQFQIYSFFVSIHSKSIIPMPSLISSCFLIMKLWL